MKLLRIVVVAVLIFGYAGIIGCGGGGANVSSSTTTLGQELEDLDAAYKKGILTEKEYNKAKKALIEKRTED